MLTSAASLSASEGGWVDVGFSGLAPSLTDFQLTVTDPAGLTIEYPLETHTSLHANSTLEDGETDVARFYVAPTQTGAEQVTIEYRISYVNARGNTSQTGNFTLSLQP